MAELPAVDVCPIEKVLPVDVQPGDILDMAPIERCMAVDENGDPL
jgi:hypothetical protein